MSPAVKEKDGRAAPAAERQSIAVTSPLDGSVIDHVPACTANDVWGAVARARGAQVTWEALGFDGRAERLLAFRDALLDHGDEFVDRLIAETGKAAADAFVELMYMADAIGFWAKRTKKYLADRATTPASLLLKTKKVKTVYRPMGVVGLIGPWNFPVILSVGDAIPALMVGNTVVIKPATITPLTVRWIGDLFQESTNSGALEIVTGRGGELGDALIDACDFVGFTGSTEVGRMVMARAAQTLTPVSLELGGKDAMIVLSDANIERAANGAAAGGLANAGQICMSVERVYVEEPVYEDFVARLGARVRGLRQGMGGWDMDVGIMTSEEQFEIVTAQVRDAVARGARIVAGGGPDPAKGRLAFQPTVLADVDHTMTVMRQETFGPVVPVMKVKDVEEAIRLANDSPYGLSGSVWTTDKARGEAIARRIDTGSVCINEALINYFAPEIPFGGWKESGIGMRHGAEAGVRKYCRAEAILIDRTGLSDEVLWYPHSKLKGRFLRGVVHALYGRGARRKLGMKPKSTKSP